MGGVGGEGKEDFPWNISVFGPGLSLYPVISFLQPQHSTGPLLVLLFLWYIFPFPSRSPILFVVRSSPSPLSGPLPFLTLLGVMMKLRVKRRDYNLAKNSTAELDSQLSIQSLENKDLKGGNFIHQVIFPTKHFYMIKAWIFMKSSIICLYNKKHKTMLSMYTCKRLVVVIAYIFLVFPAWGL